MLELAEAEAVAPGVLDRVLAGETVVVTRGAHAVAEIRPLAEHRTAPSRWTSREEMLADLDANRVVPRRPTNVLESLEEERRSRL